MSGEFDLEKEIWHFLKNEGCEIEEQVGIWYVRCPDGSMWDMTVPQVASRTPKLDEQAPTE